MTQITRNYWDKNIPVRDAQCPYGGSDSVRIGNKIYYGKSLRHRPGKKFAIIAFKVIPVLVLSILFPPIAILFASRKDFYPNAIRRMKEVKNNRKFSYVAQYVNPQKSNPTPPPQSSTPLSPDVLGLHLLNAAQYLHGMDLIKYLHTSSLVCKEWHFMVDEVTVELLNRGMITLNDFPEIKGIADVLNYISVHKNLRTLDLQNFDIKDEEDIKTIREICPDLETLAFSYNDKILEEIVKFKKLKNLTLKYGWFHKAIQLKPNELSHLKQLYLFAMDLTNQEIACFVAACPNLEKLTLSAQLGMPADDRALKDISQLQKLKHLTLECPGWRDFSPIDLLPLETLHIGGWLPCKPIPPSLAKCDKLRKLSLSLSNIQGPLPDLNHLKNLEELSLTIENRNNRCAIPSLEALSHLKKLHLEGNINPISPLQMANLEELSLAFWGNVQPITSFKGLVQLKKLHLRYGIQKIPTLKALSNLEEFTLQNAFFLRGIPNLPDNLKILTVHDCRKLLRPPRIDHLKNLEQFVLTNFNGSSLPDRYFDSSTNLKRLELVSQSAWEELPSLDKLPELQILRLGETKKLPSLAHFKNLKGLAIDNAKGLVLPPINCLELLVLNNYEDSTHFFIWDHLKQLKILHISNYFEKDITVIPKFNDNIFSKLPNLEVLSVDRAFKDLPNLKKLSKLKKIYLHTNHRYSAEERYPNLAVKEGFNANAYFSNLK